MNCNLSFLLINKYCRYSIFIYDRPYAKLFGRNVTIQISDKPDKKYKIYDPNKAKWIYFGAIPYQDYTVNKDDEIRRRYLARTANMKGDWKDNPY